jgi:hypothetical protein
VFENQFLPPLARPTYLEPAPFDWVKVWVLGFGLEIPCILVAASRIEASSDDRFRCCCVKFKPVAVFWIFSLFLVVEFLSARRAIGLAFTRASPLGPIGLRLLPF